MFKKFLSVFLTLILAISFVGCKKQPATDTEKEKENKIHTKKEQKIDEVDWKEENYTLVKLDNTIFKSEDKNIDYKDGDVAITKGGTYVLKGYYYGGIVVDTTEEVNLVFNTVQLFPTGEPAIRVLNAKKINIVLQEDTINTITDKTVYENEMGTIMSNVDLYFIGDGALFIESFANGIMSEESVIFSECTINVVAESKGVYAKKCIHNKNASVGVYSEENAFVAKEHIEIDGGYTQVKNAEEGFESLSIDILDGIVDIKAKEDGINGTDKRDNLSILSNENAKQIPQGEKPKDKPVAQNLPQGEIPKDKPIVEPMPVSTEISNAVLNIKGGKITVNAEGDGIDINGEIVMDGGTVIVYGTDSKEDGMIDFDKTFTLNGGTLICAGQPHMLQKVTSTKESVLFVTNISVPENTLVVITNSKNEELFEFNNPRAFTTFYMVSDQLRKGDGYNLVSGSKNIKNIIAE